MLEREKKKEGKRCEVDKAKLKKSVAMVRFLLRLKIKSPLDIMDTVKNTPSVKKKSSKLYT